MSQSYTSPETLSAASEAQPDAAEIARQEAGLYAKNVSVVFRRGNSETHALSDVNLAIPRGTRVTLIGASGCGKSTLLRVFADMVAPTSGEAKLFGLPPAEARANRAYALVQQSSTMLPWRTILDNVSLGLEVAGTPKAERLAAAADAMALVGLKGFEKAYPSELSGGMRQRAAIARALTLRPHFLLMDEPFGALDEFTRDRLQYELLRILEETKATLLMVTHSISEAVTLSDQVVVMSPRPGRIREIIHVDLGAHRDAEIRNNPRFASYERQLRDALHHEG